MGKISVGRKKYSEEDIFNISKKRLLDNIDLRGDDECWEWKKSLQKHGGYGQFTCGRGNLVKAHRFAYEFFKGKIIDGMFVCHKCNNPKCCNPNHLYLGTPADNWRDTIKAGNAYRLPPIDPMDARCRKLNWEIVEKIRDSKKSGVELARIYMVTAACISNIRTGKTWKIK